MLEFTLLPIIMLGMGRLINKSINKNMFITCPYHYHSPDDKRRHGKKHVLLTYDGGPWAEVPEQEKVEKPWFIRIS
jgi:hypothetical protein